MSSLKEAAGVLCKLCLALSALAVVTLAVAQANFSLMRELALFRYGEDTARIVDKWEQQIEAMKPLADEEKLALANRFFNTRLRWKQDPEIWGEKDYWATPLELLGRGMGDCEDFAIAKYTTLVLAGIDIDKLRMTYVKARVAGKQGISNTAHMVLAYYPSPTAEPMILDNLVSEIRPASERPDLTPVYGFNSRGLWVGGAAAPATTEPGTKLSRWRDLLQRAAAEGLG